MELNIFQRMSKITNELATVAKNLNVDMGKGKTYKAVQEKDILDAVKPLEEKYGVYSYPIEREMVDNQILEKETQYGISNNFYLRIKTTYRFVNIDKPEEYIDMVSYADGIDSGDKATGKAMTYADKYALMKAYKISTGDDPDKDASPESGYRKKVVMADKNELPFGPDAKTGEELKLELEELIIKTETNRDLVLEAYNVKDMSDLTQSQLRQAIDRLKKRIGE